MEKGDIMFVTIKDMFGKTHPCPLGFVKVTRKVDQYFAVVRYNTWQEDIIIDSDEYRRITEMKEQEDAAYA